jgi:hypothetical protein
MREAVMCVFRILQSNPRFQSINAYSVDEFRSALEYTTHSDDGRDIITDIMVSGPQIQRSFTWSVVALHGETTEQGFRELEILDKSLPGWYSSCNLKPVADNRIPGPKPRSEWRPITWED